METTQAVIISGIENVQYRGHQRKLRSAKKRLVSPRQPDITAEVTEVRFGPCVDGSGLARRIFTLQRWSVQPCVRPVCAVGSKTDFSPLTVDARIAPVSGHSSEL